MDFENAVKELCNIKKVINKNQIINILNHIEQLIPNL